LILKHLPNIKLYFPITESELKEDLNSIGQAYIKL
jgi:hypothetical protein